LRALVEKLAWLRHAWFFHWAHKPLCEPYREDVLRLGKLRLCRGCTGLWFGVLGSAVALVAVTGQVDALVLPWALVFCAVATLSFPAWHGRWPRPVRDLLRFTSGALVPVPLAWAFTGSTVTGLLALGSLLGTYALHAHLRKDHRLAKCGACPELGRGICSGYAEQSEAIRAWEEGAAARELQRRLAGGGPR